MSAAHETQPSVASDDAPLLGRVARGDGAALKALYDRHGARVMALALRILRVAGDAEEIVQETFVEVWRRAGEFDARRGGASAWITTMARNRAIDRLRRRGTSARALQAIGDEPPVAGAPSPLEDVEARVERERIGSALAELPDEQRKPIELAFFEGCTQQEIAERTGAPLGTVKSRVRLGLEKLASLLGRSRS